MGGSRRALTATPVTTFVWADSLPCRLTDAAPIGETERPPCLPTPPTPRSSTTYERVFRGQSRKAVKCTVVRTLNLGHSPAFNINQSRPAKKKKKKKNPPQKKKKKKKKKK